MRILFLLLLFCFPSVGAVTILDPARQLPSSLIAEVGPIFARISQHHKVDIEIRVQSTAKVQYEFPLLLSLYSGTDNFHVQLDADLCQKLGLDRERMGKILKAQWLQGGLPDVVYRAAQELRRLDEKRSNTFFPGLLLLVVGIVLICLQLCGPIGKLGYWGLGFMVAGLLLAFRNFYLDPSISFPRDNFRSNLLSFSYIVDYLRHFGRFPVWLFNGRGGMWLDALLNNYLLFAPLHLAGYWAGLQTDASTNQIYKFVIVLGSQLVYATGVYLLAKRFLAKPVALFLVGIMILSSPLLGTLHQEQDLALFTLLPFLWLLFFKAARNPRFLPLFASLFGLALTIHYPQLLYIYVVAVLFSALFLREGRNWLRSFWMQLKTHRWVAVVSLLFLCLSCLPTAHIYFKYAHQLKSDFRGQNDAISPESYEDYLKQRAIGVTSAYPSDIYSYFLGPGWGVATARDLLDDKAFFVSPAVPFVLFFLLFFFGQRLSGYFFLLLLLAWLALGIHAGAAWTLFGLLPGMRLFRQWYHFHPFFNFHLLFLIGFAFDRFANAPVNRKGLLTGLLFFMILALTRWVSPLFSIPAAALFALKLYLPENRLKPKYLLFSAGAWALLGSVPWAVRTLNDYQDWSRAFPTKAPIARSDYLYQLFQVGTPILNVANPKGLGKLPPWGLGWVASGKEFPVDASEIRIHLEKSGDFRILLRSPPPDARALRIHQFNDGAWNTSPAATPTEMGTLEFPLNEVIQIQRQRSAWDWIRWLAFLPTALSIVFLLRGSKVPSWDFRGILHSFDHHKSGVPG